MADALAEPVVVDGEGAHLAEVLPHTCSAPQPIERAVARLGDPELLHRLVEHDAVLAEQDALAARAARTSAWMRGTSLVRARRTDGSSVIRPS